MPQILPSDGSKTISSETFFASPGDAVTPVEGGVCFTGSDIANTPDLSIEKGSPDSPFVCDAYIYTRGSALLSDNRQMAVLYANSAQDALNRARRCVNNAVSGTYYGGQNVAYCLDPEYGPLVCRA